MRLLYCHDTDRTFIPNRFGILSGRPHSTGPVYYSINNLPRENHLQQVYALCTMIMPGPHEPNTDQLNNCLEPDVREFKQLKRGMFSALFNGYMRSYSPQV